MRGAIPRPRSSAAARPPQPLPSPGCDAHPDAPCSPCWRLAGAAAVALPILRARRPRDYAPDLRADPVEVISGPAALLDTEGGLGDGQLLVRFDGYVTNVGDGAARDLGQPADRHRARSCARGRPRAPPRRCRWRHPEVKLRDRGQPQPLPPDARDALLAVERGRGRPRWRRPRRSASASTTSRTRPGPGDQDPAGLRPTRHPLLRGGRPGRDQPAMGVSAGLARRLRPAPRLPVDRRLRHRARHATSWARRPTPTTRSGRAAARAEVNAPAFRNQAVTVPGWIAQPVALTQTAGAQAVPLPRRSSAPSPTPTSATGSSRPRRTAPSTSPAGQDFAGGRPARLHAGPRVRGPRQLHLRRPLAASDFPTHPRRRP